MYHKINQSSEYILKKIGTAPELALVLGSGLGDFAELLEDKIMIEYSQIPNFPVSTAPGHKGRLVIGQVDGHRLICLQGRFHYYEGYCLAEVIYYIQVLKALGVTKLLLTNAAGGINPDFSVGDLMVIEDHINVMGDNPLRGRQLERFGPRFNDMTYAYDRSLIRQIEAVAESANLKLRRGVYLATMGPSFETPAEIRMFRSWGADAVGMSTVPEVIAANNYGIRCAAISCITNMAAGVLDQPLSGEEVFAMANQVKPIFIQLIRGCIARITEH